MQVLGPIRRCESSGLPDVRTSRQRGCHFSRLTAVEERQWSVVFATEVRVLFRQRLRKNCHVRLRIASTEPGRAAIVVQAKQSSRFCWRHGGSVVWRCWKVGSHSGQRTATSNTPDNL